ncbi:Crp/Fnr family transcriptional regulator [Polaribacter reichenbachii]|uniref:Crp/Fnr family transcriptional regulator n=1 Tax=Polaribacter reichenbachii TaxID=996801 RepID=A0A1B8U1I0_9FLAO|nr:Crp/Fnr family transcriptional regulator [Polaribacter reichenbachii]APZ47321.1 Crp/Fnr family transcriptional regulator [Polaribacter reichenbachii]AUC17962.1 Crp/Fnr family transcriptional regulator [Polaribacter reichenbachii]OBY65712.1 Crp/Fnr family transcriptional regulator [Polaribacter reichenbachii]
MENLINYIQSKITLTQNEINLIKKYFVSDQIPAQTNLLEAGKVERYIYFLDTGIVKGYQNIDGKIVVQHLVGEQDFFTSLDSFMTETPSVDYYETITDCNLIKIAKPDFDILQKETKFWAIFVKEVTNQHLACKLERVKDFQILTAKERYLKFINQYPKLALNVSIDNIASFLGIEPQSLSRIRKQIAF